MVAGGYGYTRQPYVAISPPDAAGAGRPALGRAVMRPTGEVGALRLEQGGGGYMRAPVVSISPPASRRGRTAKAEAIMQGGRVTGLKLIDAGKGYT